MIYQKEMARIEASELLSLITAQAVGSGNLKKTDSTRLMNELQRQAQGRAARKRDKPIATTQQLSSMGIAVEVVKKKKGVKDNS